MRMGFKQKKILSLLNYWSSWCTSL